MTKRHPTLPTATAIDTFAAAFDSLFTRVSQRQSFRHYLMGLLLPLETNTHLRGLARALPDTDSEALLSRPTHIWIWPAFGDLCHGA